MMAYSLKRPQKEASEPRTKDGATRVSPMAAVEAALNTQSLDIFLKTVASMISPQLHSKWVF